MGAIIKVAEIISEDTLVTSATPDNPFNLPKGLLAEKSAPQPKSPRLKKL